MHFVMALIIVLMNVTVSYATEFLDIVEVSAPEINCVFDTDCTIVVDDDVDIFDFGGGSWLRPGFIQSRVFPPGEPGTPGEDLVAYLYRIDLREALNSVTPPVRCIEGFVVLSDFFPIARQDYDGNGTPDDVFVVTTGGLGNVAPIQAIKTDEGNLIFDFDPPLCPQSPADGIEGQSTFFFGLASAFPPQIVDGRMYSNGYIARVVTRAPRFLILLRLRYAIMRLAGISLVGKTDSARENRSETMLNLTDTADALAQKNNNESAIHVLEVLQSKMDGEKQDWVQDDPSTQHNESAELFLEVQDAIGIVDPDISPD